MVWHRVIARWLGRGSPTVDQFVGARLKGFRKHHGASREMLAEVLKVPICDLAKFELGQKRISASKLFMLADYFGTTVAAFFDRREAPDELAS